jgi:hypothetical protein
VIAVIGDRRIENYQGLVQRMRELREPGRVSVTVERELSARLGVAPREDIAADVVKPLPPRAAPPAAPRAPRSRAVPATPRAPRPDEAPKAAGDELQRELRALAAELQSLRDELAALRAQLAELRRERR